MVKTNDTSEQTENNNITEALVENEMPTNLPDNNAEVLATEATPLLPVEDEGKHGGEVSFLEAIYHIVCVIAGTGLLQIPQSFSQGGWLSILLLLFSAGVNIYTGRLIIYCLRIDDGSGGEDLLDGYPGIGEAAFGKLGRYLVSVFYNMAMMGSVCLYLILASLNFQDLLGVFSDRVWILILSTAILVPFVFVKSLKEVGFVSLLGALASVVVVAIVVACSIEDFPLYKDKVDHKLLDISHLGSVLGTFCFSYGGNYVYPEIYRNMGSRKQKFNSAMTMAVILITLLYIVTGTFGYLTYGSLSKSPVLFNLQKGWPRTLSLIVITFHVIFACPLLLTTISSDLERGFQIESFEMRTVVRFFLMTFLSTVSICLPFFADMMNLVGALSNTMLIFVLPIVCRYVLDKRRGRQIKPLALAAEIFILLFGVIGGSFGTADALQALYNDVRNSWKKAL